MMEKYRVHEVAKDLGVPSKDIVDLLEKYFGGTKKSQTALESNELSVVFEHYTKQSAMDNIATYLEEGRERRIAAEKERAAAREAKATARAKAEAAAKAAAKAEAEAKARAAVKQAQPAKTPVAGGSKRPAGQTQQAGQQQKQAGQPKQAGQQPKQAGQQPKKGQRPAPQPTAPLQKPAQPQQRASQQLDRYKTQPAARTPQKPTQPQRQGQRPQQRMGGKPQPAGGVSTGAVATGEDANRVDMRTVKVNLDKYNERYETIAPTNLAKKDTGVRKQKLNQRSAQKGKPFLSRKDKEIVKLKKLEMERERRNKLEITIPEEISVAELAGRLKVQVAELVKRLMGLGIMASAGEIIDYDTAAMVAMEIGAKVSPEVLVTIEDRLFEEVADTEENLATRPPIVVVMGHVDHGKTSLLDAIRNTSVTSGEAGGITQHIGAYQVVVGDRPITFLDTPGHAAFTSMRARGAQVTDIAILVVAADDGIMPQTVEAIHHAKEAGVSIIVAINKMDLEDANPDRVKQGLTEYELVPEEWGGDVICVPVSAHTKEGLDTLLEMVQLTADMKELKANPERAARGTVIEARLDKGRGPLSTILVQSGTLRTGDIIIAGTALGHVRTMMNERGERIEEAGPSMPVEISGLSEVPQAGDTFGAVEDERLARELVDQRRHEAKEEHFKTYQKVTLDNLFDQITEGEVKELPIIVKADVQGSVEAVRQSLEKITNDEVRVRVIHGAVGAVSESDVMLANASNAIIVGFNVRPEPSAKEAAERDGVEIRLYRVIYDAIDEINDAMKGLLAPKYRDVELGRAEVRTVYKISSVGTIAGCYVLEGKIARSAKIRLVRDGIVITDDAIDSLRRFKDDVREVAQGYECGIGLTKYNDIREGDIFEAFIVEEYRD
jgi:translation initiation factor IF-2